MKQVLVADDDPAIRNVLRDLLVDAGYRVTEASGGDAVLAALRQPEPDRPDLVLMDIRMPDRSGLDVLKELRNTANPQQPVIMMTAFGSSNVAIEAIQLGAYDYITKPFEVDDILATIERFFEWLAVNDQLATLSNRLDAIDSSELLIGDSPEMQQVYKTIGRVARSEATVLVTGETGTGKELVATLLHRRSSFGRGPLVKVNCAALPETLLESELFGHEKGAFTGAINQRKGRFEMANGGTIFLDEIGEMSLATQKKLLRVLQEREFERVGGTVTVKVDTRVIAATNKHLPTEVAEGRFREDLYYRLNVITIMLPPLRDRPDDIPLLVEHFLDKHRFSPQSPPARISQSALDILLAHNWPGNVRELENVVERAVVLAQGGVITAEHVDLDESMAHSFLNISERIRTGTRLEDLLLVVEREAIKEALRSAQGDRISAAAALGVPLAELERRIATYGLPAPTPGLAPTK